MRPEDVLANTVRDSTAAVVERRQDAVVPAGPHVDPQSDTETFAAIRSHRQLAMGGRADLLRSGKALWRRGTEILVQLKKAPEVIFRETRPWSGWSRPAHLHIQARSGDRGRFQAKHPDRP